MSTSIRTDWRSCAAVYDLIADHDPANQDLRGQLRATIGTTEAFRGCFAPASLDVHRAWMT
ncbi:hypothetical protein DCC79_07670 [bacterium]|nr:hypothetical protein [Chloroflexi bacterium CFX6]RIL10550.1 MAG: hypothetical protein DCC79_07670 [bacterium]